MILGHMGETLPIQLWRLDSRYQIANQTFAIKHPPSWYAKKNITITTSGVCNDAALRCALDSMGSENVMFSIDYPFESTEIAVNWLKTANITEQERNAVAGEMPPRSFALVHKPLFPYAVGRAGSISSPPERLNA